MVKINKLYTKTGDRGQTHLVGGDTIAKSSIKVDAYGDIDELNANIGVVRTLAQSNQTLNELLSTIQNELFDIGSIVATKANTTWSGMRTITPKQIAFLEQQIDKTLEGIPELKSFVLPGGTLINAELHRCRTVCRRAERKLWALKEIESVDENILIYINRLSDLLFALSRKESHSTNTPEFLWK